MESPCYYHFQYSMLLIGNSVFKTGKLISLHGESMVRPGNWKLLVYWTNQANDALLPK